MGELLGEQHVERPAWRQHLPGLIAVSAAVAVIAGVAIWWFTRGPDMQQIADEVKSSLQQELITGPAAEYNLQVVKVGVVHLDGNQYKAIADVQTMKGAIHQVALDVTTDGKQLIWQTEPGAFLFAAEERAYAPS